MEQPAKHRSPRGSTQPSQTQQPPAGRNRSSSPYIPVWYTLKDPQGHIYYYNETTQESSWEPPQWLEETDPTTGYKYYLCTTDPITGRYAGASAEMKSTWTAPQQFARLVPLDEK